MGGRLPPFPPLLHSCPAPAIDSGQTSHVISGHQQCLWNLQQPLRHSSSNQLGNKGGKLGGGWGGGVKRGGIGPLSPYATRQVPSGLSIGEVVQAPTATGHGTAQDLSTGEEAQALTATGHGMARHNRGGQGRIVEGRAGRGGWQSTSSARENGRMNTLGSLILSSADRSVKCKNACPVRHRFKDLHIKRQIEAAVRRDPNAIRLPFCT